MVVGLLVFIVTPIIVFGLVINFIYTQYRVHKRDKKMYEILERKTH